MLNLLLLLLMGEQPHYHPSERVTQAALLEIRREKERENAEERKKIKNRGKAKILQEKGRRQSAC